MYAVGIGKADRVEIEAIASKPASVNAYLLTEYDDLDNISSNIIKQTCRGG